ncbi:VOC family protein [Gemmatimonas aurantiaca]|uniref:VOC family protein n=1 Tax=Gemmatimonas aurantiaca TaxID=173480 RepID=UPI00301CA9DE
MPEALHGENLQASLTVRSLERSANWYCEGLGFVEDRRHERDGRLVAISLCAGAVRILLTQDDGTKGVDRHKGEGMSLQLTTHDSVDAIAARLVAYGVRLDTEPTTAPWGVRIIRVRDPDEFRWTISMPVAG